MKADLVISGIIALAIGAAIYMTASTIVAYLPLLVQGSVAIAIAFVVALAISLAEMPLMLFGLRLMARSKTTMRGLLIFTYMTYVTFASIYASIFVLITGAFALGLALAALGIARFASGAWVK